MKKPIYLSNSAINTFTDCGYKYKLHYIDRIRTNYTSSSLLFGGAIDAAFEAMLNNFKGEEFEDPYLIFTDKMFDTEINYEKRRIPKTSNCKYSKADVDLRLLDEKDLEEIARYMEELGYDMSDYSVKEFWEYYDESTKAKKTLKDKDFLVFGYIAFTSLIQKARLILPVLQEWIDDNVLEVHSTQEEIRIEDEDGNILRGYLDFIVTLRTDCKRCIGNGLMWDDADNREVPCTECKPKKVLMDLKTSSDPKSQYPDGCVEESQQLSIYYQEVDVEEAGYLVVGKKIRKKKEPRVILREVYGKISEENMDKVFDKIQEVLYSIQCENFEKNPSSCWAYGGCTYFNLCKSKSMKGLKKLEN